MLLEIVLLIAGLALIVFGAEWLVDGASSVARKAGLSEFVIGLTIVGFGTSCPELVVSLTGALQGNADVAVGNVVGSNLFNTLLILGVTALISPLVITRNNARRDIPIALLATIILVVMSLVGNNITRFEGAIMLILFALYIYSCFKTDTGLDDEEDALKKEKTVFISIIFILAGLAGLIFGGQLFVDNATLLAKQLGVSDKVIAITLLAGGTSLPELATCVVAAVKGKGQLALGNILGSNVFNILLILGTSAAIVPLSTAAMGLVDLAVLLMSSLMLILWTVTGSKNKLDRWEAVLMVLMYLAYIAYLFVKV